MRCKNTTKRSFLLCQAPLAELQKAGLTGVFDEWAGKRKDEIFTERYKKGNKACILVKQLIQ